MGAGIPAQERVVGGRLSTPSLRQSANGAQVLEQVPEAGNSMPLGGGYELTREGSKWWRWGLPEARCAARCAARWQTTIWRQPPPGVVSRDAAPRSPAWPEQVPELGASWEEEDCWGTTVFCPVQEAIPRIGAAARGSGTEYGG